MKATSGIIYQVDENTKGISYYSEQKDEFLKLKKVLIHHITNDFQTVFDEYGKQKKTLKSIDKLTQIGFVD